MRTSASFHGIFPRDGSMLCEGVWGGCAILVESRRRDEEVRGLMRVRSVVAPLNFVYFLAHPQPNSGSDLVHITRCSVFCVYSTHFSHKVFSRTSFRICGVSNFHICGSMGKLSEGVSGCQRCDPETVIAVTGATSCLLEMFQMGISLLYQIYHTIPSRCIGDCIMQ